MHNSQGGVAVDPDSATGNPFLLKDATPSDTCLSCHANYGQLSADGQTRGPGGDFFWMTQDVSWVAHGRTYTVAAREHGHNVVAPGYGLVEDDVLTQAPGGTYDASYLGCNSCHDPHGNVNFRLLYGVGETAANYPGNFSFSEAAPVATGNSRVTTIGSSGEEIHSQHTAYVSGMSDWCANCHSGMHSGMTSSLVHPTDENIGSKLAGNYNAYVTTGNMTGSQGTAYLPLVPFEDVGATTTSTAGPTATSKVMCLTCHRAHASPYPDAGRWDFAATFLEESHSALGVGATEPYLAYYDANPLDMTNQRSLCNKCHAQDADDHITVAP
ncbi:MAG: cytochrome c [Candidatus Abyssubacteria bacterium]